MVPRYGEQVSGFKEVCVRCAGWDLAAGPNKGNVFTDKGGIDCFARRPQVREPGLVHLGG